MTRRFLAALAGFATMTAVMACSPGTRVKDQDAGTVRPKEPDPAPGFPVGWNAWKRFREKAIIHADDKVAHTLFFNGKAAGTRKGGTYPTGSVLVKAQHHLDKSGKAGKVYQLAVMTKTGGKADHGWKFTAFDPESKQAVVVDADICSICHTQRVKSDMVFSAQ